MDSEKTDIEFRDQRVTFEEPTMANDTLGWVGAGKMGGPMSRRLVETQHRVMVLEPDEQNRAAVVDAGARAAPDLAAIGAEARNRLLDDPERCRAPGTSCSAPADWRPPWRAAPCWSI